MSDVIIELIEVIEGEVESRGNFLWFQVSLFSFIGKFGTNMLEIGRIDLREIGFYFKVRMIPSRKDK